MRRDQKQSRNSAVPSLHGTGFRRPGPAVGRLVFQPKRPANDNVPSWRAGIGIPVILAMGTAAALAVLAVLFQLA